METTRMSIDAMQPILSWFGISVTIMHWLDHYFVCLAVLCSYRFCFQLVCISIIFDQRDVLLLFYFFGCRSCVTDLHHYAECLVELYIAKSKCPCLVNMSIFQLNSTYQLTRLSLVKNRR